MLHKNVPIESVVFIFVVEVVAAEVSVVVVVVVDVQGIVDGVVSIMIFIREHSRMAPSRGASHWSGEI